MSFQFQSPGVALNEIDRSGTQPVLPQGVPAGVIGTSVKGPAFVPITVANMSQYVAAFGPTDGEKFGPLAMNEWLRNARSGLFLRVLGAGDGNARVTSGLNPGRVTNAGFIVGDRQVQQNGQLGSNPYALGQYPGRTFFLGTFMSESNSSTIFSEAGTQTSARAVPIVRGVLFTPSGVIAALSGNNGQINTLNATTATPSQVGFLTGAIRFSDGTNAGLQEFTLFLSGHIATSAYPNVITASFDPAAQNYFTKLFNQDPFKTEQAGHLLYTAYDVYSQYAVATGSGITNLGPLTAATAKAEEIAFVLTGSQTFNSGTVVVPNYEGFEDRFDHPSSPYVISQDFGGSPVNLFKIHSLDDGTYANTRIKISISNIKPSSDPTSEYGSFDLAVREFDDTDDNPRVIDPFPGLTMNPASENFIGKRIGDLKTYFDFDRVDGSQKIVTEGLYPNRSNYIRVEIPDDVMNQEVPANALPVGFRGMYHLVTSGSSFLASPNSSDLYRGAIVPPVPFRRNIAKGTGNALSVSQVLHWGVQFEANDSLLEPNKNSVSNRDIASNTKYFPRYHTSVANSFVGDNAGAVDANGTVYDADRFNNNKFTIENIQVITASNGLPDPNQWGSAAYTRNGVLQSGFSRKLRVSDLADAGFGGGGADVRKYAKFTFPLQGGFNGLNIFNQDKFNLTNNAALREMDYSATQGGPNGVTVATYRKAIDILANKSDVDIQLLTIPGQRNPGVTDYAIDAVENRFDAMYIMDIDEYNNGSEVITGSNTDANVSITANSFSQRRLDTSFAAAYYPDVIVTDPTTSTNVVVPPSVVTLGAFALNDALAFPWFAPAGFTRGALSTTTETGTRLNRSNLDTLYSVSINPIASTPAETGTTPIIYGQKTLLARSSALDRVNVRRLLIEIRRRVRAIANTFLFEPNRAATLARFQAAVTPILSQIQTQQGVTRFLVKIDTTTTTQADVENNTIRGKVFVQPTRSVEFVSLDFVVTNPTTFSQET